MRPKEREMAKHEGPAERFIYVYAILIRWDLNMQAGITVCGHDEVL